MNKIKLLVAAALLAVGTTASAQFSNSGTKASKSVSTAGWSTFYVQYNPIKAKVDVKDADDLSFNGFTVGYNHAFSVSKSIPLFVEAGIGLQYATYKDDVVIGYDTDTYEEVEGDRKINVFAARVPVSLMYQWNIPNSKVALIPFLGITMRYNFSAKRNDTNSDYDYDEDYDLFDKDDNDATWKHFQIGWQIGVNARINSSFLVGVAYGNDFSEIAEKTKVQTTSITLGYCF